MNWQYLAGLFDGEGSISTILYGNIHRVQATMCIGDQDLKLLQEIQIFLQEKGFRVGLHQRKDKMACIHLTGWHNVRKFLKKINPKLRIKKQRALEAIKWINNHDWRMRIDRFTEEEKRKIVEEYQHKTAREVGKKYKVKRITIAGWARKMGIRKRKN